MMAPGSNHDESGKLLSPRLASLQTELAGGNRAALDQFWQQINAQGAPLIEALPGDPNQALVTFLWQGNESKPQRVAVLGSLPGWSFPEAQLTRLQDSGLWYRSYIAHSNLRATYQFFPDYPDEELDFLELIRLAVVDPLNPQRLCIPQDPEGHSIQSRASILEMPQAPPQPWNLLRPGAPAGTVNLHRLHSQRLANERPVWVYTPPGYTSEADPFSMLLIFDGWECLHGLNLPVILDNLIADRLIPPTVAVMPGNLGMATTRAVELTCYPPFLDFVRDELLPWVRATYSVAFDPARNVVGGASYGGLAAAFIGMRLPELFGNVLSLSGSFWWNPPDEDYEWLVREFARLPALPLRFYLDAGLLEEEPSPGNGPSILACNRSMQAVLGEKGYSHLYEEFCGGHDVVCWRGTIIQGLRYLLGTG